MDLGGWLRSLGLDRYEAAFRENAIAADVLRDLTDQDLEKLGVLLGDRRRLLRAIAALGEAPAPPTSPVPAPSSAAAASPTSAVVELSGERPNVVTLRANQTALLKADVANEGLALENAIRQVVTEATGKSPTESRAETRKRPPSATPGPARPDRSNTPLTDLPGEGWPDALLSARQRLLKGRSSAKGQAATSLRHDVVDEGDDLDATTVKAPQAVPPRRDSHEQEAPAAATAKAPQPALPPRDSREPETRPATAKASQPARSPRDPHEPEPRAATAKGPQRARLSRDSYQPEARTAPAKAPAARLPRDSYQPQPGAAADKAPRAARPPRDSYEPEELQYPPVIEAARTFPNLELDIEEEDLNAADYDTQHEHDLAPPYAPDNKGPVAAPRVRHARSRAAPKQENERKRSSLSFAGLMRLLAVLLVLAGLTATISWHWSTIAELYQFFGRIGQQLQSQVSPETPSARPEFRPRVPQEQTSGQASGTATPGGQTAAAVASLIEADPSDPQGKRYVGSVVWRTETLSGGPGLAPELAVRADIEIPERRMAVIWSMRRNTDKSLPASHTIEIMFNLPADFAGGGIASVSAIVMKQSEEARGSKLVARAAKVTNGIFLIGLSAADTDVQRDKQLLKDRPWFDIGIVYTNGGQAILALEKGESGNRAFAQAFAAWEKK